MTQPMDRGEIAKMLIQLFERWQLTAAEQLSALGLSASNRDALTRYRKGGVFSNNRDQLDRAVHLLEIHKNLRRLFPHNRDLAYAWMKTRNKAFENLTPTEVICEQGFAGLLQIRAYLDNAIMGVPGIKSRYSLSDLIAQCNANASMPHDMKAWNSMRSVGEEW